MRRSGQDSDSGEHLEDEVGFGVPDGRVGGDVFEDEIPERFG
jgi:hypothetical protein